ncbi:MAG: diacylglycerol kinase [Armatimonadota bacterium]
MRHSLWQSFHFAGRGLQHAFHTQRTMRIHVALVVAITVALVWLDLPVVEAAAIVLAMAVVLAAELLNTAVEALVDLHVGDRHHVLAGRAKDLSAAGVLVAAVGAAAVGLLVLGRPAAALLGGRVSPQSLGRAGALLLVLALVVMVLRGDRRPEAEIGR